MSMKITPCFSRSSADLVVDALGLVLGADSGEELALGLGDAELVEGVLDVLGDVVPGALGALGGADEVVDVVEVDLGEVGAPHRHRPALVVLERLQPEVAHPLRLVLVLGDRLDQLTREALRRLVGVARLGIVEAELLLVVGVDALEGALRLGELLAGRVRVIVSGVAIWSPLALELHYAVLDEDVERLEPAIRRKRPRPPRPQVEQRPVPGALHCTGRRSRTRPRRAARRRASSGPRSRRARRRRSGRRRSSPVDLDQARLALAELGERADLDRVVARVRRHVIPTSALGF